MQKTKGPNKKRGSQTNKNHKRTQKEEEEKRETRKTIEENGLQNKHGFGKPSPPLRIKKTPERFILKIPKAEISFIRIEKSPFSR